MRGYRTKRNFFGVNLAFVDRISSCGGGFGFLAGGDGVPCCVK